MGKTITSIVLVAAAIAVNVIPGVGQAISGALVSAGLGTAAAAGIATLVTTGITSLGLTAAAGIIAGGPKLAKPPTTEGPLKTSIPPRVRAYGRTRLYGAYALFETASNGTAVDVFAVHDGPIDGIERRYLGDDQVTVAGNFVQQGADKRYKGNAVEWYETLGPLANTAFARVVALLPGLWTNDHRGDGVVTLATTWKPVKADAFQETYPQSGPVAASIAARWQRVFDWRDPTQSVANPGSWKWSENAALHLAHYRLCVEKAYRAPGEAFPSGEALSVAWATFFQPTRAFWTEAANVCDEGVMLKSGVTEPRYRSAFSHKLSDPHKDVIDSLTACFDGWTAPRADGALVVYAGRYYPPTVEIGPQHIVSYSWQDGIDDESTVNEIRITYIDADNDFTTPETDPWVDLDDMARRGAVRSQPLENSVPSHGQARRLAKRLMARIMAPYRGTVTTNVAGRIARGQRYIHLRIVEAGAVFFDGVAEITQMTRNLQTGGVTFAWVAADANVDAWNPATEEGEPATAGNRVAPLPLDTPTVTEAFVVFTDATEEGTGGSIALTVAGPDRDDLTWFVRWRVQGAAVWNEQRYSDTDPGAAVVLQTGFVPLDKTLEVEVAYQVGDGRVSDYSNPPTLVNSSIDAEPPEAAVAVTLTNWGDTLDVTTDPISRARSYRWRIYAVANTAPTLYAPRPAQYKIERGYVERTASEGWDGNIYGVRAIPDNCVVIGRFDTFNTFIGLTDNREAATGSDDYSTLDFALHYSGDGPLFIWDGVGFENRGNAPEGVQMQPGRSVAISYLNGVITFFIINDAGEWVTVAARGTTEGRSFYPGVALYGTGNAVSQLQFRLFNNNRVTAPPSMLVRTINTTGRSVAYSKALALADGPSRSYRVAVAGVNGAGAGAEILSGILTNPPPAQVTGVAVPDDPATGAVSFDLLTDVTDIAGYSVAYSTAPNFDPYTQGFRITNLGNPPAYIYGLAAGTYYAKVAAFDTWSDNPDGLSFSDEDSFVIATGGGGSGGGGGTGGGGGGYCVTTDTPVLMADGTEKAAGDIVVGDCVRTQHEETMAWGNYPVTAAETVESDDLWQALGIRGTGDHRVWLGGWVKLRDIGEPAGSGHVVKLTVDEAHTYYSAGVLSHNIKTRPELVAEQ